MYRVTADAWHHLPFWDSNFLRNKKYNNTSGGGGGSGDSSSSNNNIMISDQYNSFKNYEVDSLKTHTGIVYMCSNVYILRYVYEYVRCFLPHQSGRLNWIKEIVAKVSSIQQNSVCMAVLLS